MAPKRPLIDVADDEQATKRRRQLGRRKSEEQVARTISEQFPPASWTAFDTSVRKVDGLTLHERVLQERRAHFEKWKLFRFDFKASGVVNIFLYVDENEFEVLLGIYFKNDVIQSLSQDKRATKGKFKQGPAYFQMLRDTYKPENHPSMGLVVLDKSQTVDSDLAKALEAHWATKQREGMFKGFGTEAFLNIAFWIWIRTKTNILLIGFGIETFEYWFVT